MNEVKKYQVEIMGVEESTIFVMSLTKEELQVVQKLSVYSLLASISVHQPIIYFKEV